MSATVPQLASKWGIDSSDLELAIAYLNSHHLRYVSVLGEIALDRADPASTEVAVTDLATGAAKTIGVSPNVIAILLQVIKAVWPIIGSILEAFLSGIAVPTPAPAPVPTPAPAPVPKPAKAAGLLIGACVFLFGLPAAASERWCDCHDQARARAAFALSVSLRSKELAHSAGPFCVCVERSGKCSCNDCDCNCPDAESYAAALRQSEAKHTPIAVWVKHTIDRSVYPEAIHIRDDAFSGAEPGVVVGVWRNGDLGRFDVPAQSGTVTRERVLSAIGYSPLPKGPACLDGKCSLAQ